MKTVLIHPPPNFLAPTPAIRPLKILFMVILKVERLRMLIVEIALVISRLLHFLVQNQFVLTIAPS